MVISKSKQVRMKLYKLLCGKLCPRVGRVPADLVFISSWKRVLVSNKFKVLSIFNIWVASTLAGSGAGVVMSIAGLARDQSKGVDMCGCWLGSFLGRWERAIQDWRGSMAWLAGVGGVSLSLVSAETSIDSVTLIRDLGSCFLCFSGLYMVAPLSVS